MADNDDTTSTCSDRKKDLQHDDDDDMTAAFEATEQVVAKITGSFEKIKKLFVYIDMIVSLMLQTAGRKKDVEHDDDQIRRINVLLTAIFKSFKQIVADPVLEIENYLNLLRSTGVIISSTRDDRVKDRLHEAIRGITNRMIIIYHKVGCLLEALGFKKKLVLIDIEGFASEIEKSIKGDANVEKKDTQIESHDVAKEGNTTADETFKKSEEEDTQHGGEDNRRFLSELDKLLDGLINVEKNGAQIESHDAAKENTTTEATLKKSEEEDAQHGAKNRTRLKMGLFLIDLIGFIIEIVKLMKGDANMEKKDTQIESHPLAAYAAKGNTTTAKAFKKTEEDAQHEVEDRRSMGCCALLWAIVCIWKKDFQWIWEEFHGRNNIHQPPNYPSIYILSKKL